MLLLLNTSNLNTGQNLEMVGGLVFQVDVIVQTVRQKPVQGNKSAFSKGFEEQRAKT